MASQAACASDIESREHMRTVTWRLLAEAVSKKLQRTGLLVDGGSGRRVGSGGADRVGAASGTVDAAGAGCPA